LVSANTGRCHGADRSLAQIDERHVVAVERLVVALVDDRPLTRERVVGHQGGRRIGVLDDPRYRFAIQLCRHPVGLDVEEDVTPIQRAHHAVLSDGAQLVFA
jgi:hypothetical protein